MTRRHATRARWRAATVGGLLVGCLGAGVLAGCGSNRNGDQPFPDTRPTPGLQTITPGSNPSPSVSVTVHSGSPGSGGYGNGNLGG